MHQFLLTTNLHTVTVSYKTGPTLQNLTQHFPIRGEILHPVSQSNSNVHSASTKF